MASEYIDAVKKGTGMIYLAEIYIKYHPLFQSSTTLFEKIPVLTSILRATFVMSLVILICLTTYLIQAYLITCEKDIIIII